MSHTAIAPDKVAAYLATHYRVRAMGKAFTLRIGVPSDELHQLYRATGEGSALFITAYNPYGQTQSDDQNRAAHSRLGAELRALTDHLYEGWGADPAGAWPEEHSYLALGIDRQTAELLGQSAQQDAVVWAGKDAVPHLVCLR